MNPKRKKIKDVHETMEYRDVQKGFKRIVMTCEEGVGKTSTSAPKLSPTLRPLP